MFDLSLTYFHLIYRLFSQKYTAVGELGKATDTLDATGAVVQEKSYGERCYEKYKNALTIYIYI